MNRTDTTWVGTGTDETPKRELSEPELLSRTLYNFSTIASGNAATRAWINGDLALQVLTVLSGY